MKIIQLTNKTPQQTMGYAVVSKTGQVLVIDGGCSGNGEELRRVIKEVGGHVDLWLITHPHSDHHNAIMEVLLQPEGITYDRLGASQLPDGWADIAKAKETEELLQWNEFSRRHLDERYFDVQKGETFSLGSMTVEVLAVANPEILTNPVNNQSAVFRITEDGFTFLVLGDLGIEGGEKLLASGADVRADAVQMAHHGQRGVNQRFYEAVQPTYAFWPTPDWLWENRRYLGRGEPGDGPFLTPVVAGWMEKLHAENIFCFENTVVFDSETGTVSVF